MRELSVMAAGPAPEVGSLSGGNQQKVVMARAVANEPKVLVLHPTDRGRRRPLEGDPPRGRGQGAPRGSGVVVVSDELPDLRSCDRVLVMHHGSVVREFPRGWEDADVIAASEGITRD